jgi:hypothetical protein
LKPTPFFLLIRIYLFIFVILLSILFSLRIVIYVKMATSLPLFPQLAEMSDEQKYKLIARFIPCDQCSSCKGWHTDRNTKDICQCGHDILNHIDQGHDLQRRSKVALRLVELLEVNMKYHQ